MVLCFSELDGTVTTCMCSICMEDIGSQESKALGFLQECQHYYHFHCVWDWLVSRGTCPLCRRNVSFNDTDIQAVSVRALLDKLKIEKEKGGGSSHGTLKSLHRQPYQSPVPSQRRLAVSRSPFTAPRRPEHASSSHPPLEGEPPSATSGRLERTHSPDSSQNNTVQRTLPVSRISGDVVLSVPVHTNETSTIQRNLNAQSLSAVLESQTQICDFHSIAPHISPAEEESPSCSPCAQVEPPVQSNPPKHDGSVTRQGKSSGPPDPIVNQNNQNDQLPVAQNSEDARTQTECDGNAQTQPEEREGKLIYRTLLEIADNAELAVDESEVQESTCAIREPPPTHDTAEDQPEPDTVIVINPVLC